MTQDAKNKVVSISMSDGLKERIESVPGDESLNRSEKCRRILIRGLEADSRARRVSDILRSMGMLLCAIGIGLLIPGIYGHFTGFMEFGNVVVLVMSYMSIGGVSLMLSEHYAPTELTVPTTEDIE